MNPFLTLISMKMGTNSKVFMNIECKQIFIDFQTTDLGQITLRSRLRTQICLITPTAFPQKLSIDKPLVPFSDNLERVIGEYINLSITYLITLLVHTKPWRY